MSHQLVLEIGFKQAISNIATLLVSSLADNNLFGLYDVSSLIITGICEKKGSIYQYYFNKVFRQKVYAFLQIHKKKPVVLFSLKELKACMFLGNWAFDTDQILEKGYHSQISSIGLIIEFPQYTNVIGTVAVYEYDGDKYKRAGQINDAASCVILKEGQVIEQKDIIKIFFVRDYDVNSISKN